MGTQSIFAVFCFPLTRCPGLWVTSASMEPVEERDGMWRRSPGGSLVLQPQETCLTLESDKFTTETYLLPRPRGPPSRELGGTWLARGKGSGRWPSLNLTPHPQPPCDEVTSRSRQSHQAHDTNHFIGNGRTKRAAPNN